MVESACAGSTWPRARGGIMASVVSTIPWVMGAPSTVASTAPWVDMRPSAPQPACAREASRRITRAPGKAGCLSRSARDHAHRSLRHRLYDNFVDVHVRRPGNRPGDAVGDVLGHERVDAR